MMTHKHFISLLLLLHLPFAVATASEERGAGHAMTQEGLVTLFSTTESQPEPTTCKESLKQEYEECKEKLHSVANSFLDNGYLGLYEEIEDTLLQQYSATPESDEQAMELIDELNAIITKYGSSKGGYLARFNDLQNQIKQVENLLRSTKLPGYEVFKDVYDSLDDFRDSGRAADIAEMTRRLQKAVVDYKQSVAQDSSATLDNPSDFTILIASPEFDRTYIGNYDYIVEGWTTNERNSLTRFDICGTLCAIIWAYDDHAFIEQTLTGIPNGFYSFSADMVALDKGAITDQHLYAKAADGQSLSDTLTSDLPVYTTEKTEGLERLKTGLVAVSDGTLTIGATGSTDGTRYGGGFHLGNVKLEYYGKLDLAAQQTAYRNLMERTQQICDTMTLQSDKKQLEEAIKANQQPSDRIESLSDACDALNKALAEAKKSVETQNRLKQGCYCNLKQLAENDTLINDVTRSIIRKALELTDAIVNDERTSYKDIPAIEAVLQAYWDSYIPAYRSAYEVTVKDEMAEGILNNLVDDNTTYLTSISSLPSVSELLSRTTKLNDVVRKCKFINHIVSGSTDFTPFITNADISKKGEGWTIKGNHEEEYIRSVEAWNADRNNSYMDFRTHSHLTVSQVIEDLPNGVYHLEAKCRTAYAERETVAYLFAIPDGDDEHAAFSPLKSLPINLTELEGWEQPEGGERIEYSTWKYGTIWAEALKRYLSGESKDGSLDDRISSANAGQGWGWSLYDLTVEVKNHRLQIGISADEMFLKGRTDTDGETCELYSEGCFFSADDFKLTLIEKADNDGWSPLTGIESVKEESNGTTVVTEEYFSLTGMKLNAPEKGVYIVRQKMSDGSVRTKKMLHR